MINLNSQTVFKTGQPPFKPSSTVLCLAGTKDQNKAQILLLACASAIHSSLRWSLTGLWVGTSFRPSYWQSLAWALALGAIAAVDIPLANRNFRSVLGHVVIVRKQKV